MLKQKVESFKCVAGRGRDVRDPCDILSFTLFKFVKEKKTKADCGKLVG